MINIGRPNILPETIDYWRKVHDLIRSIGIGTNIKVNKIYFILDKEIENKTYSSGAGYQYCFWFKTEEESKKFTHGIRLLWNEHITTPAWTEYLKKTSREFEEHLNEHWD